MSLFWRSWLVATSVIFVVGILLVTFVTLEFKRDYDRLLGERLLVIGASGAAPFARAVELGLTISSVRNASALLDIPRQTDPLISGVWVLDAQSRVVEGTGGQIRDFERMSMPQVATSDFEEGWYATVGSAFVAGIPIHDGSGQQVGQLLVSYPLEVSRTRVLAMLAEVSFYVLLIASAFSLAAGGLLRLSMAREIDGFKTVVADLDNFDHRVWTMQRREDDPPHTHTINLRAMLEQSRASYLNLLGRPSEQEATERAKSET
jgi:hypothetical protein